jgi:Ca2+-binding EF-hand superfamily protein
LEGRGTVDEYRLADAFDCLDLDDSGQISKENLRRILGKHYSQEYAAKLIGIADINHNGKISYMEFRRAFAVRQPTAIEFAL